MQVVERLTEELQFATEVAQKISVTYSC